MEINELVRLLRERTDTEIVDVVRQVTEGRAGLAAQLAALFGGVPGTQEPSSTPDIPVAPDVPPHPDLPTAPRDVPPPPVIGSSGYTDAGVPTFDSVRGKIENLAGREELARESGSGRTVEEQWAAREQAGHDRLDQIRKQMKGEQ